VLEDPGALKPLLGVATSQLLTPPSTEVCAVQFSVPEPRLNTLKVCGGTSPPFRTAVKVNPVCDNSRINGLVLIVITTVIDCEPAAELIAMLAVYVPVGRLLGAARTLKTKGLDGVTVPLVGVTTSQFKD
jgi:hypothetical protein